MWQVATVSPPLDFRPLFIQWGGGASQTAVSCHASVCPGNLVQLPLNLQWLPGSFPYQEGSLLNISHTVPTMVNPCVLGVAEGSSRPDGSVSGAWDRLQGCPRCSGQGHSGIQAPGCWDCSGGRPDWRLLCVHSGPSQPKSCLVRVKWCNGRCPTGWHAALEVLCRWPRELAWQTGEWHRLILVAGLVRSHQQLLSDLFRSIVFFETLLKSCFLQDSSALRCGGTGSKTS